MAQGKISKSFDFMSEGTDGKLPVSNHVTINHYHNNMPSSFNTGFNLMAQMALMSSLMNKDNNQIEDKQVDQLMIDGPESAKGKIVHKNNYEFDRQISEDAEYEVITEHNFKINKIIEDEFVSSINLLHVYMTLDFLDYDDLVKQFCEIAKDIRYKVKSLYTEEKHIMLHIKSLKQDSAINLFIPYEKSVIIKIYLKYHDNTNSIIIPGLTIIKSTTLKYILETIKNSDYTLEFDEKTPYLFSVLSKSIKFKDETISFENDKFTLKRI